MYAMQDFKREQVEIVYVMQVYMCGQAVKSVYYAGFFAWTSCKESKLCMFLCVDKL